MTGNVHARQSINSFRFLPEDFVMEKHDGMEAVRAVENEQNWRFCAVGNIVKSHPDEEGTLRYGTKAFTGGTKVYIGGKCLTSVIQEIPEIGVIGLNRFGRYAVEYVPTQLIENVRCQAVLKPKVISIIDGLERLDGWQWWGRTAYDKRDVAAFCKAMNSKAVN